MVWTLNYRLLFTAIFISGASALIYQLIWQRSCLICCRCWNRVQRAKESTKRWRERNPIRVIE